MQKENLTGHKALLAALSRPACLIRTLLAGVIVLQSTAFQGGVALSAISDGPVVMTSEATLKTISYENHCLRISLDKSVPYRVFTLSRPPRIVVELQDTIHNAKPYEASVNDDVLQRIRSSQFKTDPEKITRIVLDMPRLAAYQSERTGGDILVRFGKETAAKAAKDPGPSAAGAAGTAASANQNLRIGEASEKLASAAAESALPAAPAGHKSKDIIAALPTNPVTIDFDNADVRDVIRVLSEMSGVNMIYGSDLRGFVTIHLDQVPFNEVFTTILNMQGLVPQQMGENILRILTPENLNTDRARSVTNYKTFYLNYAKASEVTTHLGAVRISPNARVTVDDRNNALVIMDTPEGIAAAERLIAELDIKPPQVMIETKIVQVDLIDNLDLGIQWEYSSVNRQPNGGTTLGLRTATAGTTVPTGTVGFVGKDSAGADVVVQSVGPGNRGTGVNMPGGDQAAAITFGFLNNTDLLTMTLNAVANKTNTKTLANPKIVTLNNQVAKIQLGQRIPYSTVTIGASGVSTQSTTFIDVGIIIEVKPTINADNRIRLSVKPQVSDVLSVSAAGPSINTKTAETEVIIKDGETLVIGGLISEQMRENAKKVPLLGDLPVLGVFFRSTSDQKSRTELLVFVTPRIIRD